MEILIKYFPSLSRIQIDRFNQMDELYHFWNERINVMSRKDIDHLFERHILHSLSIALAYPFEPQHRIMDVGTGGGFPGLPLAILYPQNQFILVDSIGKKIKVVNQIADSLKLPNVKAIHCRAEDIKEHFHFIVTRAVASLPQLHKWTAHRFLQESSGRIHNGLIALKGGDLDDETSAFGSNCQITALSDFFEEDFFATKKIVYLKSH